MTPQQLTVRLRQLTSKSLAITALSLGLAATVMAPMTAQAAPLRPEIDPGGSHFARPDMVSTLSMPNGTIIGAGQRTRFTLVATNQGTGPAVPVKLQVMLPEGFKNVYVQKPLGTTCSTAPGTFFNSATIDVTCTGSKVAAGASTMISIDATAPLDTGNRGALGTATPVGNAPDVNADNNSSLVSFRIQ